MAAFATFILESREGELVVAPVRPAHGNLILERLLGPLCIEAVVAGVPHVALTRVRAVSAEGVTLDAPHSLERVQRRRYCRVTVAETVEVSLETNGLSRVRDLLDLSAGGCSLRTTRADAGLRVGSVVDVVEIPLPDGSFLVAAAIVRRTETSPWDPGEGGALGLEFLGLMNGERDRLVGAVQELERSALRARAGRTTAAVVDVIVLLHDAGNCVRLKPGKNLCERSVRVLVGPEEDEIWCGALLPMLELRVGGEAVLRGPAFVEAVMDAREGRVAVLAFTDLRAEGRARLASVLKRVSRPRPNG